MKTCKIITLLSAIFLLLLSLLTAVSVMFSSTIDPIFEELLLKVTLAGGLLILGLLLLILFVVICVKKISVEKVFAIYSVLVMVGFSLISVAAFRGYDSVSQIACYADYNNSETALEQYLPYRSLIKKKSAPNYMYEVTGLEADRGIKYLKAFNAATGSTYYCAEYLESKSPLLNLKFKLDRSEASPFNDYSVEVESAPITKELNGVEYKLYVEDNSCAVLISEKNKTYYAYCLDIDLIGIDIEDFEKTAVEQYALTKDFFLQEYQ